MTLHAAPPRWSDDELDLERQEAIQRFRRERLEEPLEDYLAFFARYEKATRRLLHETGDLARLQERAPEVLCVPELLFVFRYLAGPPMSEDDLKAVADIESLAPSRLRGQPEHARHLVGTITSVLDPRRFGWIKKRRAPTDGERETAVQATAALIAAQRVATKRRNEGKTAQEERVRKTLLAAGYIEVERRNVAVLVDAPGPGTFCAESKLGTRKADFIIGLHDRRVMPVECKVSNSYLNSIKRLNNDAAAKAEAWRRDFGETQVVPVAVLSGLYKLSNLQEAQARGLAIFWAHELNRLTEWIARTGSR